MESDVGWHVPLVAGGVAGLFVDLTLFPLDTIKTRAQAKEGFLRSGGLRAVYSGLFPVMVVSIPNAALFFFVYEGVKNLVPISGLPAAALAGGVAEVVGTTIRVPAEVIKQRAQATRRPALQIFRETLRAEGSRGLYRGWAATITREVPFSCIQLSIWEAMKSFLADTVTGKPSPLASAMAGGGAGVIAATVTTPLDVVKTRIMLAQGHEPSANLGVLKTLGNIYRKEGWRVLFSGLVPRVTWISIGGFIFLGTYDAVRNALS